MQKLKKIFNKKNEKSADGSHEGGIEQSIGGEGGSVKKDTGGVNQEKNIERSIEGQSTAQQQGGTRMEQKIEHSIEGQSAGKQGGGIGQEKKIEHSIEGDSPAQAGGGTGNEKKIENSIDGEDTEKKRNPHLHDRGHGLAHERDIESSLGGGPE